MDPPHAATRRLYARLLALRREADVLQRRPRGTYTVRALDDHTLGMDYHNGALVVFARLSGGPAAITWDVSRQAAVVLTTEDEDVADAPQPIGVTAEGARMRVYFQRPGAVVLVAD
jgi:hypothetical protein